MYYKNVGPHLMKKLLQGASFLVLATFSAAASEIPEKIDFVKHVQPIFAAACNKCHGPEKQKGELRLDSKTLAMKGGQTGKIILPNNSKESLLIQRVLGVGEDPRMPMKAEPLKPVEIGILKAWIDQGAVWPDSASVADAKIEKHWSYVKPQRPALAKVSNP